jgi:hypothetical protein
VGSGKGDEEGKVRVLPGWPHMGCQAHICIIA